MNIKQKYEVISVEPVLVKDWFLKKHYAKTIPSIMYCFGLYEGSKLIAVCSWGNGSINLSGSIVKKHQNIKHFELNRLVAHKLQKNALSYFVSRCIKMMPKPSILVSYADANQKHHGYIYQATNWLYTGLTKPEKRYYNNINGKKIHVHSLWDYNNGSRATDNLPDFIKVDIEDYGKHRYVFFNGSNRFKSDCLKNINYEILPYPKGENIRYNDDYHPTIQLKLFL